MKTCIVTPEYPPDQWGGLARTVERVARHVRDMGGDVHVAHFTVTDDPFILLDENRVDENIDGITVHHLSTAAENLPGMQITIWDSPFTRALKMMYQSLELLHREEYFDILHGFFLYPAGYISGLLARRFGIPSIVTLAGNDVKKYIFSPDKVAACRSGLENADKVTAMSRDLLDMADSLCPVKNKGKVIFNSVAIPEAKTSRLRCSCDTPLPFRIGCAGIFKYAKGLPYLFKAVSEVREQFGIALELIGTLRESEKTGFHGMVAKTGIEDILSFRTAVPHGEIISWLQSLDAFVLPSVSEGCPNILMEAMACGLPCIATDTGAVAELIENGISGLIVPWGNSRALARAITRVMLLPDRGEAMGHAAKRQMENFSSLRERHEWESVYREIIRF